MTHHQCVWDISMKLVFSVGYQGTAGLDHTLTAMDTEEGTDIREKMMKERFPQE